MKSLSVRAALMSAVALALPLLTFAGGQPAKVRMPGKDEARDRSGVARALQQGKGGGLSLSQTVIRANAYRVQTEAASPATKDQPGGAGPNLSDSAFRK
jgi:hypothetical protein